jgi:hypothetical protein
MLTGLRAKTITASVGDAAMNPQAPVNIVDGYGSAVGPGRGEVIDLARAGVHLSTAKACQPAGWSLI